MINFFSKIFLYLIKKIPYFRFIEETQNTQTPISFKIWFFQKILGFNKSAYWPVHYTSKVEIASNIYCGIETCPGYMPGCYIQGMGKIFIDDYTQIAPNVGIITANHNLYNNKEHTPPQDIKIGKYCWIGMNSVILPGVELGDFTVVGAGSVVISSFTNGYCVIAGNPAREIKILEKEKCIRHKSRFEYNGYIRSELFQSFRKKHLNI
jgi:acetyltransferase-like isoleucine patch superfamily enzyme